VSEPSATGDIFARSFKIGSSYEVSFSPDGRSLAALGRDVVIWETARKQRVASAHPFSHPSSVSFTPDGQSLIVKNTSGEVVVLGSESLEEKQRFSGSDVGEGPGAIAIDDTLFIDASWNGDLMVRSITTGEILVRESHPGCMVSDLAVTSDRTTVAYVITEKGDHGSRLLFRRQWPLDRHAPEPPITIEKRSTAHIALADNGLIAVVTDRLTIFDLDGTATATRPVETSGTGRSLAWRPKRDEIVLAGAGEAIAMNLRLETIWHQSRKHPSSAAYDSTGELLALGGWSDGRIGRLHDN
jgi:WD40 repeat protein